MAFMAALGQVMNIGAGIGGLASNTASRALDYNIDKKAYEDPNSKAMRGELGARTGAADSRAAPTATTAQQGNYGSYGGAQLGPASQGDAATMARDHEQFRAGQSTLAQQLAQQAQGQGPSLAEGQLRQATDRNVAQQMAVAAAQGGAGNPGMAQRNAALGAAQANQQAGRDAAQMKMQEQLAARQQLAGVLDNARGQDIGFAGQQAQLQQQMALGNMDARNQFALQQAGFQQQAGLATTQNQNDMYARNAQMEQQTNLANLQSQLQTMGLNDEQVRALMGMRLAQNEADRQAQEDYQKLRVQQHVGITGIDVASQDKKKERDAGYIDQISDPSAKYDIESLSGGFAPRAPSHDDWQDYRIGSTKPASDSDATTFLRDALAAYNSGTSAGKPKKKSGGMLGGMGGMMGGEGAEGAMSFMSDRNAKSDVTELTPRRSLASHLAGCR